MTIAEFLKLHRCARASAAEKALVVGYVRRHPRLPKVPTSPLIWWDMLHLAEASAGIRRPATRIYWN